MGVDNPLVSVYDEATGALEYNLRVGEKSFHPKVFSKNPHRIEVKNLQTGEVKSFPGLKPSPEKAAEIEVVFS